MRRLIVISLVGALLWSGYWFIGKTAKFHALNTWLDDRRAAGWVAEYSDFSVVGFPNRFDSRFTDLTLASPQTGIGWQAPLFHIFALSYKPNHIIAAFPNSQVLSFPLDEVTIDSSEMMASLVFEPDTKLAIDRLQLLSENLSLKGSAGWKAQAERLAFSTRQNPETRHSHDVIFDAKSVTPTQIMLANLDPNGQLPATIDTVFLDLKLGFNAPWDRVALETGLPEVTEIQVNSLNIGWGVLGLGAKGHLNVAPNGVVTGRLALEVRNWREVLNLTVTSGLLDQAMADTIATGLNLLTAGSEDPNSLSVPLILQDGRMALGPIPLGFAPRFIR